MSKRITDPALEMRYGRREAERRLRVQRETERNAAIFNLTPEQYQTAQEVKDGRIVRDDECELEQRQPHEWYCVVHNVTKIAGTTEPIRCDHELVE